MIIRTERAGDAAAIRSVVAAAFLNAPHSAPSADGTGDPGEAALIDWLRADGAWLPELSLVAIDDDASVIGHVVCTRGRLDGTAALGLGPLSVAPDRQGRGVGSALMQAVIHAADASGEPLIALLGDPRFYGRFGFRPAAELGVAAPDPSWGDYFQALALQAHLPDMRGAFAYAAPFARL